MRHNLKVPFPEKDEAKKLGARWDAARKLWYVQGVDDLTPFARWSPMPHDGPADAPAQKSASARPQQSAGIRTVGANYVEVPRICDCLPWEVCAKCEATALTNRKASHG